MGIRLYKFFLFCILGFFVQLSYAETITAKVFSTKDDSPLGEIIFTDSKYGLLITPNLQGLPPGGHGFHLHAIPDCGDHGMKAGDHYDPANTKTHLGPYGEGHLGDLPVLTVDMDGKANIPVLAPRLSTKDLTGLAVMIHEGADTYSDIPKLGGGAGRIACAVFKVN